MWQLGADVFVNTSPWASHTQRTQAKARAHARGQIWRELFTDPGAVWDTVSKPYRDDIDAGNDAHAAGRATFDLLTLLMGGEGALGKGAAATGAIEKTAGKAAVIDGAETAPSKVKQLPDEAKKIAGDTQDGGAVAKPGEFEAPKITRDRHGNLTNGKYTVSDKAMTKHLPLTAGSGKSVFLTGVYAEKAVLDGAAYADANNLWVGDKAKVPVLNGPIGIIGRTGELTNYINIYRNSRGAVHGSPGSAG